jgi:RNA-directed DNA polymerase
VHRVATAIVQWKPRIIDLDLRAYFDTVRHHVLLEKIARQIKDDELMRLLKLMLTASDKQGVLQGDVFTPHTLPSKIAGSVLDGHRSDRA